MYLVLIRLIHKPIFRVEGYRITCYLDVEGLVYCPLTVSLLSLALGHGLSCYAFP